MHTSILKVVKPKKHCLSPSLDLNYIQVEYSIAAGSANITVGNESNQFTPDVNEWNDGGNRTSDFDI